MIREPVTSSNVASIGWEPMEEDQDVGTLEVEFHKGGVYQYANVPRHLFEQFLGARSPGKFLGASIAGQFDHERVG
jgi:hypothetical protein